MIRSPLTSAKGVGREVQTIDELELSEPGITSALLAVLFLNLFLFPKNLPTHLDSTSSSQTLESQYSSGIFSHLPFTPIQIIPNLNRLISLGPSSERQSSSDAQTTSIIGVMQALISVFFDNDDKLRCIVADSCTRITFLMRSPLYYVCVSKWREPESVVRPIFSVIFSPVTSFGGTFLLSRLFETTAKLWRYLAGRLNR